MLLERLLLLLALRDVEEVTRLERRVSSTADWRMPFLLPWYCWPDDPPPLPFSPLLRDLEELFLPLVGSLLERVVDDAVVVAVVAEVDPPEPLLLAFLNIMAMIF